MRISNSFSEGEIQVMDFIVQTLLRGGSPSMAVRNKDFASLCRKVMAMKAKVHEKQLAGELSQEEGATSDLSGETQLTEKTETKDVAAEPLQQAV